MADALFFFDFALKSHEVGQFNPKLTLKKNLLTFLWPVLVRRAHPIGRKADDVRV